MHYEVVLINRETGEAMTTIAVSSNEAGAADVAWEYNSKRFGDDIDDYRLLMFTHDKELDKNPEEKLYADYFEVEDITERKEEERMQNNTTNDMENKNTNEETVNICIYADETGLYTKAECDGDNLVDFDVPVEIVREWFYVKLKHNCYPDLTFEKWLHEESYAGDFEFGFVDFAKERGYKFERGDGIDLNKVVEQFKERFRKEVANYIEIIPGSWDVYFYKDDQSYSTQGDVHLGDTWEDFLDWLVEDMKEMGDLNIFTFDFRPVWVGADEYLYKCIEGELAEKINNKINENDNVSYAEYITCNLMESAEIARNNGNLYDLDRMVHLSEILGFKVSYGFYHYVECKLTDGCSMDLDETDKLKLMNWLYEYALGKECD